MGLVSSPRYEVTGQEEIASSFARGGSGRTTQRTSLLKGLSSTGQAAQ